LSEEENDGNLGTRIGHWRNPWIYGKGEEINLVVTQKLNSISTSLQRAMFLNPFPGGIN
jgi:hypothetical protein